MGVRIPLKSNGDKFFPRKLVICASAGCEDKLQYSYWVPMKDVNAIFVFKVEYLIGSMAVSRINPLKEKILATTNKT